MTGARQRRDQSVIPTATGIGPMMTQATALFDPREFAQSLIDAGVPVVVVKSGTLFPSGWLTITAAECDLSNFVYGQDDLAAVAGHGGDVVDIDSKAGARPEDLPIFRQYGIVRTPTGGWHFYVPSTGYGQISPLRVAGKVVGDYCGGTRQGGSRRLFYLPGSARLNHSDPRARGIQRGYMVQTPVDLDALFDSDPDDRLIDMLVGAGGSLSGEPG